MAGMLNKFENLTESDLVNPKNLIIVKTAPERLNPGIIAKDWKKPIANEVFKLILSRCLILKQYLSIK
tara:strand:- start:1679 stop:1882 length:204 start_codon:yes stop_codon:yes gene_type:complete